MMKSKPYLFVISFIAAITPVSNLHATNAKYWSVASSETIAAAGTPDIAVKKTLILNFDLNQLLGECLKAPDEGNGFYPIEIPLPDGTSRIFHIFRVPVVHPDMRLKYPFLHTWAGYDAQSPITAIRLDATIKGFHAMILDREKTVFIDPYNRSTTGLYQIYYRKDAIKSDFNAACYFNPSDEENMFSSVRIAADVERNKVGHSPYRSNGITLRTYRSAVACTGEYASFHGGTVAGALSAILTSLNRVSAVYEYELAIRLTLVPTNDTIIFLNAATDPYDNNNGGVMLTQNQQTIAARIGNGNYDLGHVFSTGGGGIAGLGVICSPSQKARGVTGSSAPVGDPFDIDYVAHEMGHQFGGNHTFNGTTGSCAGNINTSTAYEPGSGTTIMAYAGICSPQNLALHSDPYFHSASFDEILDYVTLSLGGACPVSTPTGNNPPIITSTGTDYYIPYQTPFLLEGVAYDPDGDTITYSWEQFDTGPAGSPTSPVGNAPLFRSLVPSLSPIRYFPKLSALVNNANSLGERLPTYARDMSFRLTVRDGKANGGGVTYEDVLVNLYVINTGAPFLVTSPNTSLTWNGGSSELITWDVSLTDIAPINAANVDIFLSTDGGFTYPYTLASGVPNTGQATITVPSVNTTQARVMVRGSGNVFFDISNVNFAISTPQGVNEEMITDVVRIYPNPASANTQISIAGSWRGTVNVELRDASGRILDNLKGYKNDEGFLIGLPLEHLTDGFYTAHVKTGPVAKLLKLIVRKDLQP